VKIDVAQDAAYALLPGGSLVAWGSNARGQLGITPRSEVEATARGRSDANTPTAVVNVADAIDVAAGYDHALALTRAGIVFVWGYNINGQLGVEMPVIAFHTHAPAAMDYLPFPMQVPGLTDVAAIASGANHCLALRKGGTVWGWGANKNGQVGDSTVVTPRRPVQVAGVRGAVGIAAGGDLSAAILADGTLMTWGAGNSGLGRQSLRRDTPYPTPAPVPGVAGVRAVAIGSEHMLALTNAGTVFSWGDTRVGEVGHDGAEPKRIDGLTGVASVSARTGSSLAVLANGTIMVWGLVPWWPRVDPFGDPTISHWPIPLVIKGLKNPT
jgi:alpha-tubulin suppressor-like RCC1 family protein